MKPGHGKDDVVATPDDDPSSDDPSSDDPSSDDPAEFSADGSHGKAPPVAVGPAGTYGWLVPGSETLRALEVEAERPPLVGSTQIFPDAAAAAAHEPTQILSEVIAGLSVSSGTMLLPDGDDGGVPAARSASSVSGTMILPDGDEPIAAAATARPAARAVSAAPSFSSADTTPGAGAAPPMVGERIGQYEIIRELGSGGMGIVFLARDDRLGRRVAIKVLQTGNPELTRRFIVEARATARCSHENIVVIYEVGELQGSPFMVLEYLQGQTLAAVIKKSAPMPPSRAVELIVSVVRALDCAHEQGIVHRDLKPENVLLTDGGTIKVLDFGIAKVLKDEARGAEPLRDSPSPEELAAGLQLGARSGIIGTMAYMSPEQWGAGGEIDNRTDIWATGLMLFQLLSGHHPYETLGPNPYPWVIELDSPMPSLKVVAPQVPEKLAELVDTCLRKHKEERFPDARSLLRALEAFLPGRFVATPLQIESGPYAGLRSFQEEDAGRFFGRSREISAMVTRILDWPLMAAVGPSGVGKSSFVRAGIVPALKASGENWESLVVRPGRDPVLALAALLAPLVGSSANLVDDLGAQKELAARLVAEPGYFGSALRSSTRRAGHKLLLFIDQFEELYTLGADAAARRTFTACLAGAADDATSPVRVIVSMRSDFLDRVAEDPHFMNELAKGLFFLGPPSSEGLREAIVQPAEMAGYRFETPRMVDEMLRHLEATPGALPLLQFTAAQLWETRDPTRKLLTEKSYLALGGIAGALVSHADRVIAKLTPEARALARSLFVHLVTVERTRAVRDLDELRETAVDTAELDRLVNHLVESRLLVVQTGGGSSAATVEIVHESLIETWPTLRRWLDESHEDSVFLEQLRSAARQWQAKKRDIGLLWRGEAVQELARFQRRYRGELADVPRAFSEAVFGLQTRGARRRRRLLVAGGAFLTGLLAVAAVALVVIRNSQKQAVQNAEVATRAQSDAQRRLQEVVAKERERQRAEALQRAAQKEAASANTKVAETNEELAVKNDELKGALERAKEQRGLAEEAKVRAEQNEKQARDAKEQALLVAQKLEQALKREKERADRLNAQLGALVELLR
jgi:serine/threonine protein kinase